MIVVVTETYKYKFYDSISYFINLNMAPKEYKDKVIKALDENKKKCELEICYSFQKNSLTRLSIEQIGDNGSLKSKDYPNMEIHFL